MSGTTYIGIDPGLSGAIAFLRNEAEPVVAVTPTVNMGGAKRDYDIPTMIALLNDNGTPRIAWIERAQAMRHKGKAGGERVEGTVSSFRSGYGYGIWHGLLTALNIPFHVVAARSWQRIMLA